jgi:ankyrin repeat protein
MASPVVIDLQTNNSQKNELNFNATFPDIIQYLPSEQIKTLINENKNNNEFISRRGAQSGFTALHWACIKNDIELVKILLFDCKVDLNSKGSVGETPIFICVK